MATKETLILWKQQVAYFEYYLNYKTTRHFMTCYNKMYINLLSQQEKLFTVAKTFKYSRRVKCSAKVTQAEKSPDLHIVPSHSCQRFHMNKLFWRYATTCHEGSGGEDCLQVNMYVNNTNKNSLAEAEEFFCRTDFISFNVGFLLPHHVLGSILCTTTVSGGMSFISDSSVI